MGRINFQEIQQHYTPEDTGRYVFCTKNKWSDNTFDTRQGAIEAGWSDLASMRLLGEQRYYTGKVSGVIRGRPHLIDSNIEQLTWRLAEMFGKLGAKNCMELAKGAGAQLKEMMEQVVLDFGENEIHEVETHHVTITPATIGVLIGSTEKLTKQLINELNKEPQDLVFIDMVGIELERCLLSQFDHQLNVYTGYCYSTKKDYIKHIFTHESLRPLGLARDKNQMLCKQEERRKMIFHPPQGANKKACPYCLVKLASLLKNMKKD